MSIRTEDLASLRLRSRPEYSPLNLTGNDLELLRALSVEPTMADVARALGLSSRQARRRVEALVNKLGVASYRGAIALAAARGLIPEPPFAIRRAG